MNSTSIDTSTLIVVDNSSMNVFALCPRKYYYRHVLDLSTRFESPASTFGTAFHAALYLYYQGKSVDDCLREFIKHAKHENSLLETWRGAEKNEKNEKLSVEWGAELFVKYTETYPLEREEFQPLRNADGAYMLEQGFALEIDDEDPNKRGILVGKIDAIMQSRVTNEIYVWDHKTTSKSLTNYWSQQFNPNNQVTTYLLAARTLFGVEPRGMLINGICTHEWVRGTQEKKDSKRFLRIRTNRAEEQITSRINEIKHELSLLHTFNKLGFDAYYMNAPQACNYYGRCAYAILCLCRGKGMRDHLSQTEFVTKKWMPFDELKDSIATDNKEIVKGGIV